MAVRLSALRAGRALIRGRLLVLIYVKRWINPEASLWLEEVDKVKTSKDLIRIRTCDFDSASTNIDTAFPN
jgi:hypothetical protein